MEVPPCNSLFEDYVLDLDRRELTRGSEAVAIGPQVFDLLVYLVQNREHVVSKDDLLDAVWGGRIVSESTLTSHINAVRKAIGDSGEEQRLVRTIARKGFRFVGEVREADASDGVTSPKTEPATSDETVCACADPSRQAVDRRPAVPEPERRPRAGILRRRRGGGHHHRAVAHSLAVRDRAQFELHLQGPRRGREAGRPRAGRALRAGRQRAQGGEPGAHHRTAHRCRRPGRISGPSASKAALDDIFELQDQVAASVVGAIAPQLERAEIERAKRKPTENLDAYDYYLRGMANLHRGTREAIDEALPLFDKAIELDPDFASAYGDGGVVPFLAQGQWLDDRSHRGRLPRARGWPAGLSNWGATMRSRSREAAMRSPISPATSMAASPCSTGR